MSTPRPSPFRSRITLKRRLLALLASVLLVLLILVSAGIFVFVRQTEHIAWEGRQDEASRYAQDTISVFFREVENDLGFASTLSPLLFQGDSAMSQNLVYFPVMKEVIYLDENGAILGSTSSDEPVLANQFTIAQSEWFNIAKSGRRYIGNVQVSSQDVPYMIMAIPTPTGVLATRLDVSKLWTVVQGITFGDKGQAYLLSEDGTIIAHNNLDLVLARTRVPEDSEINKGLNILSVWRGEYDNLRGERVLGVVRSVAGTPWTVVTEIPVDEARATSRMALQLLVGGLLAFAVIILFAGYRLLNQFIFNPVNNLRVGAQKIGEGVLTHQIPLSNQDEIGQVTEAFNTMVNSLREREDLLVKQSDELADTNEKLIEASRLKDEFLSTMSHELRTPLNAILGYSGILLMGIGGQMDEKAQTHVKSIERSGDRLLKLINDILDIAKIEAGRMKLVMQPTSVQKMAKDWYERVDVLIQNKNLQYSESIDPAMPEFIMADTEQLAHIANNLLSNAIKFTSEGRIELTVKRHGENWQLEVSDSGVGIPPEAQEYIFDEFRQVDGSYSRSHGGTGLGLAIVKKLAMAMGGNVNVTSKPGVGSIFTVTLPLQIPTPNAVPVSIEVAK